ncbi:cytochrome c [Cohaesibacter sp. CAU 1516]|uniref:c-type cytochrome n=1 Tax=Cohaesibacter sp. CAU 1516 TaxID=2576038 RepID=UPI001FEFC102|nr:cytochrome c [Cohaesibacter sp. CAU 1516]
MNMNRSLLVVTISAGVLAFLSGALYFTQIKAEGALLKPGDSKIVALGQSLYQDNCASCHGDNLEGQPDWQSQNEQGRLPAPPHDETGHTWHHADDLLFGLTKLGIAKMAKLKNYETDMPAYEGTLTDDEIIAVLSFIKSRWPQEIRDMHDERNRIIAEREKQ